MNYVPRNREGAAEVNSILLTLKLHALI